VRRNCSQRGPSSLSLGGLHTAATRFSTRRQEPADSGIVFAAVIEYAPSRPGFGVLVDVCDAKRTAHGLDTNTLRNMTQPYHMSKPTEAGIARFTALLDELSGERDVVRASMFGMPGMKRRGGKAFCGLYGEDMIFKLEGEAHSQALSLEGAHLFEPMAGRPMKAWIQVPPEHESQYGDLARAAEAALGL